MNTKLPWPARCRSRTRRGSILAETLRVILPMVILGVGVLIAWASGKFRHQPQVEPEAPRVPEVLVAKVDANSEGLTFVESGSVVPYREITLAAEVSGRIVEKAPGCRAGRFVEQGTVLLQIDPRDYEIEIKRLTHEVQQASVGIEEAEVDISNTKSLIQLAQEDRELQAREVARLMPLVTGGAAAASELDRARSAEITAKNALQTLDNRVSLLQTKRDAAKAALELARAKLEKARLDLDRTEIKAPCDGVITREMVETDSFVQRGTALVQVEDTSAVEVLCNLRSDYLSWLWAAENRVTSATEAPQRGIHFELPRIPATVSVEMGDERYQWKGVLNRYDGFGLDQETRTVPCRILVSDPIGGARVERQEGAGRRISGSPPALVRGMFVQVSIHVDPDRDLLDIPLSALQLGNKLWVVDDGRLRRQPVDVVLVHGDRAIVEAGNGLEAEQQVVISPLADAQDGMEVRVAES